MNDSNGDHRIARFLAYAEAFETAYATDDWTVLEPFFTPGATSELNGAVVEGRGAVIASFREGVQMFDHRFDSRRMRFIEGPRLEDGAVYIKAAGDYRRDGLAPLELVGEEWFYFEGDLIQRHLDRVVNATTVMEFLGAHAGELRAFEAAQESP